MIQRVGPQSELSARYGELFVKLPRMNQGSHTEIWTIRHGRTAYNAEGRIQGHHDVPLNQTGEEQARALVPILSGECFQRVYSSDSARAFQTARLALNTEGFDIRKEDGLREWNMGVIEGMTFAEVEAKYPAESREFRRFNPEMPIAGGESFRQFSQRSLKCLEGIAVRHRGERVLVFTHGGVINVLLRQAYGVAPDSPQRYQVPNCGLSRWRAEFLECGALRWRVIQTDAAPAKPRQKI